MENFKIEDLPEDVLLIIFSYFDDKTILRAKCVNREWNFLLSSKKFYVWKDFNLDEISDIRNSFLVACEKNSTLGVKYLSKIICERIKELNFSVHDLWNEGLVVAARNGNKDIVKIVIGFSVSHGTVTALEEAVKASHHSVIDILLKELNYNPRQLTRIFNSF